MGRLKSKILQTCNHFVIIFFSCLFINTFLADGYAASVSSRSKHHAKRNTHYPAKAKAHSYVSTPKNQLPWSLEVGLGYGQYQHMFNDDGQTVLARIGIAKELYQHRLFRAGIEVGVQSGNSARLDISESVKNELGGLPVDSIMKPTLDVLLTSKVYAHNDGSFFGLFKAGAILRRWQFTRGSVNDLTRVYPEFQVGMGQDVNRTLRLSLAYQGIVGRNPNFKIITQDCLARVAGIPWESGIILGLSILFN